MLLGKPGFLRRLSRYVSSKPKDQAVMSGWSEYCSIQGTKRKLKSGFTGESKKPGKKDQELLTSSGRSFLKSNCVRPPHPKGWGMLMGRTPGFLGIVKYPLTRFS